jgi:hypothetical protein
VDDALHLHWTLAHARWRNRLRLHGSESRDAEFVRFMAVPPLTLFLRHRALAGGESETIDMRHQIFRGEIDNTLACAYEVVGSLSHLPQAKHATPTQPPRRRHRRQIRRAVRIQGADERYGCSEIEDGRVDRLVHRPTISVPPGRRYPHLAVKPKACGALTSSTPYLLS